MNSALLLVQVHRHHPGCWPARRQCWDSPNTKVNKEAGEGKRGEGLSLLQRLSDSRSRGKPASVLFFCLLNLEHENECEALASSLSQGLFLNVLQKRKLRHDQRVTETGYDQGLSQRVGLCLPRGVSEPPLTPALGCGSCSFLEHRAQRGPGTLPAGHQASPAPHVLSPAWWPALPHPRVQLSLSRCFQE